MADDSLFDIGYNRPPGIRSSSSENSSARQSHDIHGSIVVTGAADEAALNSHPLLGGQNFDAEVNADNDDDTRRFCCVLKLGRASIRISLGLAVWVFALVAALAPKSAAIIVLINSLNAVFLGIIAPAGLYMLLKPVHLDFGDIALFGMAPNHIFAILTVVYGVGAWIVSLLGGVKIVGLGSG